MYIGVKGYDTYNFSQEERRRGEEEMGEGSKRKRM
jgi:hypothetical protein